MSGVKRYEYRKRMCKKPVDRIVIYSTAPRKQIVGEAEVLETLEMDKEELWQLTEEQSGITKDFYDKYFKERATAVAYRLGRVLKYDTPMLLSQFGIQSAPQSFIYLSEDSLVEK